MSDPEIIFTKDAPLPAGHYSQGIKYGDLIYVSGQLPIDPKTGKPAETRIEDQVKRALLNVKAILESGGSSIENVLKTTVYISDISLWNRVNKTYSEFFGDNRPARAVVPVKELHFGLSVEIEAIGFIKRSAPDMK